MPTDPDRPPGDELSTEIERHERPYKFAWAASNIVVAPAIRPLNIVWRRYERALVDRLLNPIHRVLVARVKAAGREYEEIREAIQEIPKPSPTADKATRAAAMRAARETKKHHTKRFSRAMRNHLGVNVGPMLPDTEPVMKTFLQTNVDLIKTIPRRHHAALLRDLTKLATDKAFDQEAVEAVLSKSYRSSGYNLRRLTRDQTQKLTAQLDRTRQQAVGITQYRWLTVGDERVRPTHAANNGKIFSWDTPPPGTGHPGDDIQCRCHAQPVIPTRQRTPVRR